MPVGCWNCPRPLLTKRLKPVIGHCVENRRWKHFDFFYLTDLHGGRGQSHASCSNGFMVFILYVYTIHSFKRRLLITKGKYSLILDDHAISAKLAFRNAYRLESYGSNSLFNCSLFGHMEVLKGLNFASSYASQWQVYWYAYSFIIFHNSVNFCPQGTKRTKRRIRGIISWSRVMSQYCRKQRRIA